MRTETPHPKTHRTIQFVDVVGSTALYDHIGDEAASARVGACLEDVSRAAASHRGNVVKSLGDGLMIVYPEEETGVAAAFELIAIAPRHRLRVRVGMHSGEVLEEKDDVFGQAVNTAARIAALAKASELLVSRDVFDHLPENVRECSRRVPGLTVKGLGEPLEVFVLVQQDSSATLTMTGLVQRATLALGERLELSLEGRVWMVGSMTNFTLGRGAFNDLVLDRPQVSRCHAFVSHRRGKYVLTDESVNGTWLVPDDVTGMHLLREEGLLHGTGNLYLGVEPGRPQACPIRYRSFAKGS